MSVETAERVELDVDLDAVVPCQTAVVECEQPAMWLGYAPCCKSSRTLCAEHRQRVIDRYWSAILRHGRDRIVCNVCGVRPMPEVTWRPL